MGKWDVYRDQDGNPVTITEEQAKAIWHALYVVDQVREAEGCPSLWAHNIPRIEISKSRLLGRMLHDGRPPLDEKPPTEMGACAYYLTDPELCPYCGGARNEPGRSMRWHYEHGEVVTEVRCARRWHTQRRTIPLIDPGAVVE